VLFLLYAYLRVLWYYSKCSRLLEEMPVSSTGKLLALYTSECAQLCIKLLLSRLPVWLHAIAHFRHAIAHCD
jgi:hypothetical protein